MLQREFAFDEYIKEASFSIEMYFDALENKQLNTVIEVCDTKVDPNIKESYVELDDGVKIPKRLK